VIAAAGTLNTFKTLSTPTIDPDQRHHQQRQQKASEGERERY